MPTQPTFTCATCDASDRPPPGLPPRPGLLLRRLRRGRPVHVLVRRGGRAGDRDARGRAAVAPASAVVRVPGALPADVPAEVAAVSRAPLRDARRRADGRRGSDEPHAGGRGRLSGSRRSRRLRPRPAPWRRPGRILGSSCSPTIHSARRGASPSPLAGAALAPRRRRGHSGRSRRAVRRGRCDGRSHRGLASSSASWPASAWSGSRATTAMIASTSSRALAARCWAAAWVPTRGSSSTSPSSNDCGPTSSPRSPTSCARR